MTNQMAFFIFIRPINDKLLVQFRQFLKPRNHSGLFVLHFLAQWLSILF